MAVQIISGASADVLTIDSTPKAARVILYGADGTAIVKGDRTSGGVVPGTTAGVMLAGADYKTPVLLRAAPDGSLYAGDRCLLLYDRAEGAAVNTNTWIQTTTTSTITQASGVITFNAGNSVAITTGAMHTSHRFLPFINRTGLIMRIRAAHSAHFGGGLIEHGFGAPSTATVTSAGNGAFWRKDGTGQYVPVVSINGSEQLGNPISNATFVSSVPAGQYASFEVEIRNNRAVFTIYTTLGVVVNTQIVDVPANSTSMQQTHLQAFVRQYNTSGTGTAVQCIVDDISVWMVDHTPNKSWGEVMSGMGFNSTQSPTVYTQTANYTNALAPTVRTLAAATPAEATLGGLVVVNSIAGSATVDYALFGFQVPSPYTFYFTGIRIPAPLNQVAAVATTATIFSYFMAFNSSAASLATTAPYAPRFVGLGGIHTGAVALAANAQFSGADIIWQPKTPIAVMPGRFLHIGVRELVGTATATETYLWNVAVEGYFE